MILRLCEQETLADDASATIMPEMEVLAHGIDMVDCARLAEMLDRHGERFLNRVITARELSYCLGKKRSLEHLAGRFAAKEAVMKVLGTGWSGGISWTDIEIYNNSAGQPGVRLTGRCRQVAGELGMKKILITISHIQTHAIASAIGLACQGEQTDGEQG